MWLGIVAQCGMLLHYVCVYEQAAYLFVLQFLEFREGWESGGEGGEVNHGALCGRDVLCFVLSRYGIPCMNHGPWSMSVHSNIIPDPLRP